MRCLFTGNIKIKLLKIITILILTNLTLANVNHKNTNTGYSKYLLVSADINELYGVIKTLHMKKYQTHFSSLPFYAYYSKYANKTIYLIITGVDSNTGAENVGTQPAVLATYVGIKAFNPDVIISIGTAGGIKYHNLAQNDVLISNEIKFYSRRLSSPKFHEYGLGKYKTPIIHYSDLFHDFKFGTVCSGDSFDNDLVDKQVMQQEKCDAIDMEAAGVAWTSITMHKPVIAVKVITDFTDDPNSLLAYRQDMQQSSQILGQKIKQLLDSNQI